MTSKPAEQSVVTEAEPSGGHEHPCAGLMAKREYEIPAMNTMLERISKETGKSYGSLLGDIVRLCFAGNGLKLQEYFELRLYDDTRYTPEQKLEFVGAKKCRAIWEKLTAGNTTWGILMDKVACGSLLKGLGLPTSETVAIYSRSMSAPALACLRSSEDIARFLRDNGHRGLFGKPLGSCQSLGTIAIDRVENDMILAGDGSKIPVQAFADFVPDEFPDGYIIQSRVTPHADIARICGDRVATVRMVTTCIEGDVEVIGTAIKIPAGASMADNYWRSGNIIADVDPASGVVGRAVSGLGLDQVEMPVHPDTNAPITGTTLPLWDDAVELARSGHRVLNSIPLIGWDIAVSDAGPVIIEANELPDLRLLQYASGKGFFDDRFKAFLKTYAEVAGARKAAEKKEAMKNLIDEDLRQVRGAMKRAG